MKVFQIIFFIFFAKYASAEFQCPKDNGLFADPEYCDQYYSCKDGVPALELCPNGLVFDASLPSDCKEYPCVYLKNHDCGDRRLPRPKNPCPECLYDFETKSSGSRSECNKYRICSNGAPTELSCPQNLAFNSVNETCDWSDVVESCDAELFTGFTCPEDAEHGQYYECPNKCNHYFICYNGKPRWMICSKGRLFDPKSSDCVKPEYFRSGKCYQNMKALWEEEDREQRRMQELGKKVEEKSEKEEENK